MHQIFMRKFRFAVINVIFNWEMTGEGCSISQAKYGRLPE